MTSNLPDRGGNRVAPDGPAQGGPRVLQVIKGLGRGGAEMLLLDGQREAAGSGVTPGYVYFLPWKGALAGELRSLGAEVLCLEAPGTLSMFLRLRRLVRFARRWRADLIHCHLPLAGVVGRLAGRMAGLPVIYTEHNVQERYHPATRLLNRATWRLQAAVVAVSAEVEQSILRHLPSGPLTRVVRNGIPIGRFRIDAEGAARVRKEWRLPQEAPVVGTVAVFRRQKALDDWLEAARRILEREPAAHFLLVGDGPLRGEIEGVARQLGLAERVRFAGLQEDVRPYLSAMDLFMSSSIFEGLPLALLEAMAMERPIVATAVGGVPEAAENGVCALLLPPRDPGLLANRASALLEDPERARSLGRAARRRVEEQFSTRRMQRDLMELYLEVLSAWPAA